MDGLAVAQICQFLWLSLLLTTASQVQHQLNIKLPARAVDILAQEPAEKVARASIKYRVRVQSDHIPSIKPECSMELGTSKATSHSPCRYRERRQC